MNYSKLTKYTFKAGLVFLLMIFSYDSIANFNITKRKYRKGFHFSLGLNKKGKEKQETPTRKNKVMQAPVTKAVLDGLEFPKEEPNSKFGIQAFDYINFQPEKALGITEQLKGDNIKNEIKAVKGQAAFWNKSKLSKGLFVLYAKSKSKILVKENPDKTLSVMSLGLAVSGLLFFAALLGMAAVILGLVSIAQKKPSFWIALAGVLIGAFNVIVGLEVFK